MRIKISILVLFLSLISCQKKEIPVNKFVGTWYDTEYVVPSLTIIKIKKDSTFSCTSGACTWRGFSRGKWRIVGDSIELSSIKSDTCYRTLPFVDCNPFEKRKDSLTIPNCNSNESADFLIFDRERFYIKNDSLVYKLRRDSKCPDTLKIVFAKTQKVRK
ncbi:hypothetical protein HNP37_004749 [Flavobacterium nitrogenifigens]|uniref:Lipocalin-like domain-containing protein n=2 Tax=Flavobacterium TaxID=237 RepID=A0A7W7J1V1_9FLAO|nr:MULTISPECIES: hypothetical protein [Flavobacterium]MBB4804652.1 hypothetical protein [Flavobacterium nitrogenifigens]MBB6389611.1 hypothetical protein [Flavobacterium notoginsengisoli]